MTAENILGTFGLTVPEAYLPYLETGFEGIQAVLLFAVGWIISRWAHRLVIRAVQARKLDLALGRFAAALLQWTILAAAFIAALEGVGFETTSLIAVFASAGIAIGLALQGSLSHFASGVLLLVFRPFTIGDVVTTGGTTGRVFEIGLFATTLITPDNCKVIIPNGSITADTIVNATALGTRRADVVVGVAYGEDLAVVEQTLRRAVADCSLVSSDPAPDVVLVGLAASAVEFQIMGWCAASDLIGCRSQIRRACYDALNQAGIEIPFDQIVVHQAPDATSAVAK